MIITTVIVDDEQHAVDILAGYVNRTPWLELSGTYTNPLQALDYITSDQPPMLVLMDVDMPEISGIKMTGLINGGSLIVFTTSYKEYALEAFENNIFDYLLKPVSYERFLRCMQKVKSELVLKLKPENKELNSFFVKTEVRGKLIRILIDDILYIESKLNYIHIHINKENIKTYLTIHELMEKLPKDQFIRIHRSFIINTHRITSIENGQVKLDKQVSIPLGRSYHDHFFQQINPDILSNKRDLI
jgi:two-component system LytT family response regulator